MFCFLFFKKEACENNLVKAKRTDFFNVLFGFQLKQIIKILWLPVAARCQFRHHHPASPGLQVSLSCHLAARSILMHLSDTLHLSTTP